MVAAPGGPHRDTACVLIVDDDAVTRMMAQEFLAQNGFTVIEADDGLAALDLLEQQTPDIIVLDVEMPHLSGFDTCARLRQLPHLAHVPVLMLTGLNDTESIDLAFDAGATDFATKPVNWSLLRHRLRYLLRAARIRAENEQAAARIHQLAYFDKLTGLANREYLDDRLTIASADSTVAEAGTACVMVGIDDVKRINLSLGTAGGDALLREVARRLCETVSAAPSGTPDTDEGGSPRSATLVARLGDDEFGVMLPGSIDPLAISEMIQAELNREFDLCGEAIRVTSSIGISRFPLHADTPAGLLECAATAMHLAKSNGKNLIRAHDESMTSAAQHRFALESALHQALQNKEFEIHYQPQWRTHSRELVGAEALLRWHSQEFGRVSPADFIPLAESSGQIVQIGDWVLMSACQQAVRWQRNHRSMQRIAVNISALQFLHPGFSQRVADILDCSGLAPASLELEITESVLACNAELAIATLAELKQMGVQLSIDDFGTGYSSLSQLKSFPVDRLKIDQSFIRGVTFDRSDIAITEAILGMARSMNLSVVAEGVETIEQLDFLKQRQCAEVQGYYLSRPLPVEQFSALLRAQDASAANDGQLSSSTGTDG